MATLQRNVCGGGIYKLLVGNGDYYGGYTVLWNLQAAVTISVARSDGGGGRDSYGICLARGSDALGQVVDRSVLAGNNLNAADGRSDSKLVTEPDVYVQLGHSVVKFKLHRSARSFHSAQVGSYEQIAGSICLG